MVYRLSGRVFRGGRYEWRHNDYPGSGSEMAIGFQPCPTVNGLPLPELLVVLIRDPHWVHPGEARLREVIPFLVDSVDFLTTFSDFVRLLELGRHERVGE
jgi:hypothetical protein